MNVESFIQNYGYWAVFLGSMIEGESIILTASILAASQYLSIARIAIVTFIGTLIADQSLYYVGYFYGPKAISYLRKRFPQTSPYLDKAASFLNSYQTAYILSFRFIYGIRIVSPLVIGAHRVGLMRFAILNVVAALIWTILSCAIGYGLGLFFKPVTISQIGLIIMGCVVSLWAVGWLVHRCRRNYRKKSP